jgi:predicted PhzF superfamily epimerase YddE/YHI9
MTHGGRQKFVVVDAFTDRPFAGNPAAVCVMDGPADEDWMKAVAREMNLSETAFLHPEGDGTSDVSWRLRWLTPLVEVDLCGHATLASAHVLWETGRLAAGAVARFLSRSGPLGARRQDGSSLIAWGGGGFPAAAPSREVRNPARVPPLVILDFPTQTPVPAAPPPGLAQALGAAPVSVARGRTDTLVELASAATVRDLRPDMTALAALDTRCVMVTAPGDRPGIDFVSRFFGPRVGIPEDPVTGAAHTLLGPFWGARLGKQQLVGYQASARGGTVYLQLRGDRIDLGGYSVTVSQGDILGPG